MTIHVPGRATNTTDQRDAARLAAASAVTRTVPDDEQAGARSSRSRVRRED